MAISYPITIPTGGIKDIQITQNNTVASSSSRFTGQQQYQVYSGQWWQASVTLVIMDRATVAQWQAFLAKLKGKEGSFMMGDPDAASPLGTPAGTPLVNGASQTGGSLATDGWTPSATGVLLAGDYIQVGNHMYMVLNDVDADGSGEATIDVWPRLRADVTDNAAITTSNTKGIWKLDTNSITWSANNQSHYTLSFTCEEYING